MDLTNISILIIPLGVSALQSGIKLNETHSNFATKFSNGSLYSLLAIMLSFMKVMSFEDVTIKLKLLNNSTMSGFDFSTCFFVLIAVLLMGNYMVVDQIKSKFLRCFWSSLFLLFALTPSYFIIFYKHYLI